MSKYQRGFRLYDDAAGEWVDVHIEVDNDMIEIYATDDVWLGVEVADGALRGVFGPKAEITLADRTGVMVEERFE